MRNTRFAQVALLLSALASACSSGELELTKSCPVSRPITFTGVSTTTVGRSTFRTPIFAVFAWPRLVVSDKENNRLIVWDQMPTSSSTPPDRVFGQEDFETRADSDSTLYLPQSSVWDGTHFIVAEGGRHRVLIWKGIPASFDVAPDVVLGRSDPNDKSVLASSPAADTFNTPSVVVSDGTHLFVADYGNNRVLGWKTMPTRHGQPADFVLGQDDFTDNTGHSAALPNVIGTPTGMAMENGRLAIASWTTNRVVVWSSLPTTNNAAADVVVGAPGLTDSISISGIASARSLYAPRGLAMAGGKLIVADTGYNRVLVFNQVPTSHYAEADRVIGRSSFRTGHVDAADPDPEYPTDADANGLSIRTPHAVASDGACLSITDHAGVTLMPLD